MFSFRFVCYNKLYEVIALICACDHCYYLFEAPELPEQCPDCGKQATRPANKQERAEYLSRQTNSQEEAEEWD